MAQGCCIGMFRTTCCGAPCFELVFTSQIHTSCDCLVHAFLQSDYLIVLATCGIVASSDHSLRLWLILYALPEVASRSVCLHTAIDARKKAVRELKCLHSVTGSHQLGAFFHSYCHCQASHKVVAHVSSAASTLVGSI